MDGKSSNGTTQLWRHLAQCKPSLTKNKQSLLKIGKNMTLDWFFFQETLHNLLTKMIIAHKQPFLLVEHPLFQLFFASLQPRFKFFGCATAKYNAMQIFTLMRKNLFSELKGFDNISLATNLWKLLNQSSFMVVSCHYISAHWDMKKQLISFKELPTPHTGLVIANQLVVTITEWKLLEKVAFIMVDNASSNNVAVAWVLSVLQSCNCLPPAMKGKFFHVQFAAHIINLIVKDGLNSLTLSEAITKIQDSV